MPARCLKGPPGVPCGWACFSNEPPGEKFGRLGALPAAAQENIEQLPSYKELNEMD